MLYLQIRGPYWMHGQQFHAHDLERVHGCDGRMPRSGVIPPPPEIDLDPAVSPVVILKALVLLHHPKECRIAVNDHLEEVIAFQTPY